MSKNWFTPDRDELLLLPPSVQEWLPEDHLVRFVADVVEKLDLTPITGKYASRRREGRVAGRTDEGSVSFCGSTGLPAPDHWPKLFRWLLFLA